MYKPYEISLIDVLGTDIDHILDQVELKVQISKLYEKLESILTPREREIVQLRYGLTPYGYKTQREIAQKLDISRSYVSRIEKRALKKLRKELKSEKSLNWDFFFWLLKKWQKIQNACANIIVKVNYK